MDNQRSVLQVTMFGNSRLTYNGQPILSDKNHATRTVKLLLILLHSIPAGIPRDRLVGYLYGHEEMADVTNNLRVTCHRLKKMLTDAGLPEYEYISVNDGVYSWQSPMETRIDSHLFLELTERAEQEPDEAKQIEYLRQACDLYTGEFLQNLSGEEWVLMESMRYHTLYENALHKVCDYLQKHGDYTEVLRIVAPACRLYPFDGWQSVRIDCYIALDCYAEALREYESTSRMLFDELGIEPTDKMISQMEVIASHISDMPRTITEIRSFLREQQPDGGAFFCTIPGFRDIYRLLCRIMERYGQSIYLMLCTISDARNTPPHAEKLKTLSARLEEAIRRCLRRCDSFTRYSDSQYLVLLLETRGEDCHLVSERITDYFCSEHKSWKRYLNFYVTSIAEIEDSAPKISFEKPREV